MNTLTIVSLAGLLLHVQSTPFTTTSPPLNPAHVAATVRGKENAQLTRRGMVSIRYQRKRSLLKTPNIRRKAKQRDG
ncbi:hypothetical protein DSO57_1012557 [Entomophthora muscae]|uniref:Uncharacterized protein n=1 Tax=Entomophthora muscae TaxID=34485 RepID=A0ACC2TGK8_9FUNG|nr:hypothetical protein DSO57_1012557 [Entomophthora muscae]